jgi:hypothetical protein
MLRSNPQMLQQVRQSSPQIADAIQRGDYSMKKKLVKTHQNITINLILDTFLQHVAAQSPEMQQQMELDRLASLDPFDPEVQRRIHDIIK